MKTNITIEVIIMKAKIIITVILLLVASPSWAINSDSIIDNEIEYYFQTDKSVYSLGEDVEMLFRVTNLSDQDVLIPCSRDPEFNLLVQEDADLIWMKYPVGFAFSPGVEILSGEYVELFHAWDMKDMDGVLTEPGTYDIFGLMYNAPWNNLLHGTPTRTTIGLSITIIPEPCSFVLLMVGLPVLIRKSKR